jgi:hypothetical protein
MVLEWLRRRDPAWDEQLRNYLFTEPPILEVEQALDAAQAAGDGSLGIGSLKWVAQ